MEFFGYKHLEEITVRRQDDQLYMFREGDFKRLHRQDIEDMLLLLMHCHSRTCGGFTIAVESYQKKKNLSRPDSYRSDLRKITPYTAYHDIQGIIYQDDMDINYLMRTNKLHKFSDGTLNHVRTALNDIAIGIQMEYLPKRKWSKKDKQRARVMINAIDKKLRDRRLMCSLEKFVGGRPYGGDLRLLRRTILFYHMIFLSFRLNTSARNPIKEILLKLNLPDHRSILTDSKVTPTKPGRMTKPCLSPRFIANYFNAGILKDGGEECLSRSDEVLKLKNFKKDATLKLFESTNQERSEHVGPEVTSSQDGKVYKMT
ncbi:hypothetical protein Tco_0150436 [Tanacetum coccineum]